MIIQVQRRKGNTYFIHKNGVGVLRFENYHMPEDLAKIFARCYTAVVERFTREIYSLDRNLMQNFLIEDFLRYVLTFEGVSDERKFAVIYSLLTSVKSEYVYDVYNNTVVHDILTRQIDPIFPQDIEAGNPSIAISYIAYVLPIYYALPIYKVMHIWHLGASKALVKNWFAGTLEEYTNRVGLLNFLGGDAESFDAGVNMGFAAFIPPSSSLTIHEFLSIVGFGRFVNFRNETNSSFPVSLDNLKDKWIVFNALVPQEPFDLKAYAQDIRTINAWILNNYSSSSPEVQSKNLLKNHKNIRNCTLFESCRQNKVYDQIKPLAAWLLYLYHHISARRFHEITYSGDTELFFNLVTIDWLLAIDKHSEYDDIPLHLLKNLLWNDEQRDDEGE